MKKTYLKGTIKKLNDDEINYLNGQIYADDSHNVHDNNFFSVEDFEKDISGLDLSKFDKLAMGGGYGT